MGNQPEHTDPQRAGGIFEGVKDFDYVLALERFGRSLFTTVVTERIAGYRLVLKLCYVDVNVASVADELDQFQLVRTLRTALCAFTIAAQAEGARSPLQRRRHLCARLPRAVCMRPRRYVSRNRSGRGRVGCR